MIDAPPLRIAVLLRRLRVRPDLPDPHRLLGPCEGAALAAALTLRGELGATATAIAIGPARREDRVLAVALRAGCDRAVRVFDHELEEVDYFGTATVLAAAVRRSGFDLVLCGDRAGDEPRGAIGPALAELLAIHHVSRVVDARRDDAGRLVVTRAADGRVTRLAMPVPALLALARFDRRPANDDETTPGASRSAAMEQLDLTDLGLSRSELAARAAYRGSLRPVSGPNRGTILPTATALVQRLRDEHLLD